MLRSRLNELGSRIWARTRWMGKALAAVAVPIVAQWLLEVLELVDGEARFWIALLAGGFAVFEIPNDPIAPARATLERSRRAS